MISRNQKWSKECKSDKGRKEGRESSGTDRQSGQGPLLLVKMKPQPVGSDSTEELLLGQIAEILSAGHDRNVSEQAVHYNSLRLGSGCPC